MRAKKRNLQSAAEVLGFRLHSSFREDSAELRFKDNLMFIAAALAPTLYRSTQLSPSSRLLVNG